MPAIGELSKFATVIRNSDLVGSGSYSIISSTEYDQNKAWTIGINNNFGKLNQSTKYSVNTPGIGFCYLSGPINNPFTEIQIEYDWKDLFPKIQLTERSIFNLSNDTLKESIKTGSINHDICSVKINPLWTYRIIADVAIDNSNGYDEHYDGKVTVDYTT